MFLWEEKTYQRRRRQSRNIVGLLSESSVANLFAAEAVDGWYERGKKEEGQPQSWGGMGARQ